MSRQYSKLLIITIIFISGNLFSGCFFDSFFDSKPVGKPPVKVAEKKADPSLPPKEFIVYNRFLGEGRFGNPIVVISEMNYYDAPRGNIVGKLSVGEELTDIGSKAYTYPIQHRVKLLKDYTAKNVHKLKNTKEVDYSEIQKNKDEPITIHEGESIYLLMYTGEGTYLAWYKQMLLEWFPAHNVKDMFRRGKRKSTEPYIGVYMGSEEIRCEYWTQYKTEDDKKIWYLHKPYDRVTKIDWHRNIRK